MDDGLNKKKSTAAVWAVAGAVALTLILGFTYLYQIRNYAVYRNPVHGTDMFTYYSFASDIVQGKGFPPRH